MKKGTRRLNTAPKFRNRTFLSPQAPMSRESRLVDRPAGSPDSVRSEHLSRRRKDRSEMWTARRVALRPSIPVEKISRPGRGMDGSPARRPPAGAGRRSPDPAARCEGPPFLRPDGHGGSATLRRGGRGPGGPPFAHLPDAPPRRRPRPGGREDVHDQGIAVTEVPESDAAASREDGEGTGALSAPGRRSPPIRAGVSRPSGHGRRDAAAGRTGP